MKRENCSRGESRSWMMWRRVVLPLLGMIWIGSDGGWRRCFVRQHQAAAGQVEEEAAGGGESRVSGP